MIAATVDTFLGLSAYAHIRYLSGLLGEERVTNALLYTKGASSALLDELKRRPSVVGIGERTRALVQLEQTFGQTMGAMMVVTVLFAGMIAFGSVLNAVLVSLSERERQVGTFEALGYSPLQVTSLFAGESYLLNGWGIFLGLFAGAGLAHALSSLYSTELYRFPTVIVPSSLAFTALLMVVFVGLAQLVVYWLIMRLNWLEVLNVRE